MTPKYFQTQVSHRDRWILSYADVLTILLILFVAIAAKGLENMKRTPRVAPAAPVEHAAQTEVVRTKYSPALLQVKDRLEHKGFDLRLESEGVVISLPQAVLFSSGEDRISSQAQPMIASIADVLRDIPNQVNLVGYADAVPIHNHQFKSNWDLSMARTSRILEILSRQYGISESRFSITSFGPYRPVGPNDTTDGRARNRRVEILILADTAGIAVEAR